MKSFEPGKVYYYRYLNDDPWYHYIFCKCIKRTEKTVTFQRSNGTTYRARVKSTWEGDAEQVKLDGWIWLESTHEFKPGLEECNVETWADLTQIFPDCTIPNPQPVQPVLRLATSSAAPFAVLVDD